MADIVIKVSPDGIARHLHTEALDLSFLGATKKVTRVSDVEYNPASECWEAIDRATGEIIAAHRVRSKVIEMEAAYFGERL